MYLPILLVVVYFVTQVAITTLSEKWEPSFMAIVVGSVACAAAKSLGGSDVGLIYILAMLSIPIALKHLFINIK
jgi:hypothetical protein